MAVCLVAAATVNGICDARSLWNGSTTQTSANSVTIPSNTTLLFNGTVQMAAGKNVVALAKSSFVGASINTALLTGSTAGPLLDGTAGAIYFDEIAVSNTDTSDSTATAATIALHDNRIGMCSFSGGAAIVLSISAGYYGDAHVTVWQSNAAGIATQIVGANSTHFNYYKSLTLGVGLDVEDTNGLYFDYLDLENSTTEEILVGNSVSGPVNMTISGGYIEPNTGAWDVYGGPDRTSGTVLANNVTWWGYGAGCGPAPNGCNAWMLSVGAGGLSNNGALNISSVNNNGSDEVGLGVYGDGVGLFLAPTTGAPFSIQPCSTNWCLSFTGTSGSGNSGNIVVQQPLYTTNSGSAGTAVLDRCSGGTLDGSYVAAGSTQATACTSGGGTLVNTGIVTPYAPSSGHTW